MSSVTLLEHGFCDRSIFIFKSAPANDIKAVVKVEGFGAFRPEFSIEVTDEKGVRCEKVLEINRFEEIADDGTYEILLEVRKGNGLAVMTYCISCGLVKSESSPPFMAITHNNQEASAKKCLLKYQLFNGDDNPSRDEFSTKFQSIFMFRTQDMGKEVVEEGGRKKFANEEIVRKLSRSEIEAVVTHFFGDSPQIPSSHSELDKFMEWFNSTTEKLNEEPFGDLFTRGFIFVYLDCVDPIISEAEVGSFILMCAMKDPGNIGIIIKTERGIAKRPLIRHSSTSKGVAQVIEKYEDLRKVLQLQKDENGPSAVFVDKKDLSKEAPEPRGEGEGTEEYPGPPLVI